MNEQNPDVIASTVEQAVKALQADKNNIPPKIIKRNEYGLIEGVNYVFNEDGTVNWRKMIKPEFLVPKKENFEKRKQPVPTSIEGLDDKDLLILLGGIKDLAQLRGFINVGYTLSCPNSDYVAAVCRICWIPNFETEGYEVTFSGIGDAHPNNTTGFTRYYLAPMAENRAFVRSVRNFLKISILSQEEVGASSPSESTEEASNSLLDTVMKSYNISFEKIKSRLVEEKVQGAESFNSTSDIPRFIQLELVGRIKAKAAAKGI